MVATVQSDTQAQPHVRWREAGHDDLADKGVLTGLSANQWEQKGVQRIQTNLQGVEFSLRPLMSWQIWWKIPISLIEVGDECVIG